MAQLCHREGIHPTIYYKWLKDFMEAGKARMRGDTVREATSDEVKALRRENERLKQLVADLANLLLKKKPELGLLERRRHEPVSAENKREMIELVRQSPQPKRTTIAGTGAHTPRFIVGKVAIASREKRAWWIASRRHRRCGTGWGPRKKLRFWKPRSSSPI